MKRFRFALDGLVRVREQEVREQQKRVATAARAYQGATATRDARRALLARMQVAVGESIDPAALVQLEDDRAALRRQIRLDEQLLAARLDELRQEQSALELASKREEAVLKLRERRYLDFTRRVLQDEQKEHDEIASRLRRAA